MAELQEALRRYHADNGYYPTTDQGLFELRDYYSLEGGTWDGDPGMVLPRAAFTIATIAARRVGKYLSLRE